MSMPGRLRRGSRERLAGQLPDHELQVFSRNHAIIVHIKDCEYEAQSVFPAGALAAGFQSMHKLLQSGERISCKMGPCRLRAVIQLMK